MPTETPPQGLVDQRVSWENASEILALLKDMRHTREFEPRFIPKEYLQQILAAGRWSSSLYNNQPWYFVVIAERGAHKAAQEAVWKARQKLRRWRPILGLFRPALRDAQFKESLRKAKAPNEVIFDHSVLILGCVDDSKPEACASAAMALNNMALEATRLDMGCAFTSAPQGLNLLPQIKSKLGVPGQFRFFVGLMVGFPKRGGRPQKGKRKEISQISHWI